MALTPYVPISEIYQTLFAFCGVTIQTAMFGNTEGWLASDFANACIAARQYLDDNYPEDEQAAEQFEAYYNMLDNYSVNYWSTEWHYVN